MTHSTPSMQFAKILYDLKTDPTFTHNGFVLKLTALIYLRWADFQESKDEFVANTNKAIYTPVLPKELRWSTWKSLPAEQLHDLLGRQLPAKLKSLRSSSDNPLATKLFHMADAVAQLGELSPHLLRQMASWLADQPFENSVHRRNLLKAFDQIIDLSTKSYKDVAREALDPNEISQLIAVLGAPAPGERVYDPCFGSARFLTAVCDQVLLNKDLSLDINEKLPLTISGTEINSSAFAIGLTRLALAGINEPELEHSNSLMKPITGIPQKGSFDLVVANPPWGLRVNSNELEHFPIKTRDATGFFVQHALSRLCPNGRAVIVVPNGFLYRSGQDQELRRELIEQNSVEAIIALPENAFAPFSAVRASILVLRHSGPTERVRMIDSEPFFEKSRGKEPATIKFKLAQELANRVSSPQPGKHCWDVDMETLEKYEWDLTPRRRDRSGLEEQLDALLGKDAVVKLRDCCQIFTSSFYSRSEMTDIPMGESTIPFIRIKDIQNGQVSKSSAWLSSEVSQKIGDEWKLKAGDILLSKSGTIGKLGIVSSGAVGAVASKGVYALRSDQSQLDPNFLMAYLDSIGCRSWLSDMARGATIQHLPKKVLDDLSIPLPSIQTQRQVAKNYRAEGGDALVYLSELLLGSKGDPIVEIKSTLEKLEKLEKLALSKKFRTTKISELAEKADFVEQLDISQELKEIANWLYIELEKIFSSIYETREGKETFRKNIAEAIKSDNEIKICDDLVLDGKSIGYIDKFIKLILKHAFAYLGTFAKENFEESISAHKERLNDPSRKPYFAYGTNMDEATMLRKCPNAIKVCRAMLTGYDFAINSNGRPTILSAYHKMLYGILWQLTPSDEKALDLYEGAKRDGVSTKEHVHVTDVFGVASKPFCYIDKKAEPGVGDSDTFKKIIQSLNGIDAPESYLQHVKSWQEYSEKNQAANNIYDDFKQALDMLTRAKIHPKDAINLLVLIAVCFKKYLSQDKQGSGKKKHPVWHSLKNIWSARSTEPHLFVNTFRKITEQHLSNPTDTESLEESVHHVLEKKSLDRTTLQAAIALIINTIAVNSGASPTHIDRFDLVEILTKICSSTELSTRRSIIYATLPTEAGLNYLASKIMNPQPGEKCLYPNLADGSILYGLNKQPKEPGHENLTTYAKSSGPTLYDARVLAFSCLITDKEGHKVSDDNSGDILFKNYDVIVSSLVSKDLQTNSGNKEIILDGKTFTYFGRNHENYRLLKQIERLSKKGRMAVILTPEALLSRRNKPFWEHLISKDYLQAIIEITNNPGRPVPAMLLVIINKRKEELSRGRVLFAAYANGSERIERTSPRDNLFYFASTPAENSSNPYFYDIIEAFNAPKLKTLHTRSIETKSLRNANLSHPGFFSSGLHEELEALRNDGSTSLLSEIADVSHGVRGQVQNLQLQTIPYVNIKAINPEVKEEYLDLSLCTPISDNSGRERFYVVNEKCILVARNTKNIRAAIFDPVDTWVGRSEQDILVSDNIFAIFPKNELVDIEYLYHQLHSQIVINQIKLSTYGLLLNSVDVNALHIPMLQSLKEQKSFSLSQKYDLLKIQANIQEAKKIANESIKERQEAEFRILRFLTHNLRPKLGATEAPMKKIENVLKNHNLLNEEAGTRLNGDTITVADLLDTAYTNMEMIKALVNDARKLVDLPKAGDYELYDIRNLFDQVAIQYKEKVKFKIRVKGKTKEKVLLHKTSIVEAINSLLDNAQAHAFEEETSKPEVIFKLAEDDEYLIIDYQNNGKPFPENLTEENFLSIGIKRKDSEGEGIGGAIIKHLICDNHRGTFEIIRDDIPTHFVIRIPLGGVNG